MTYTEKILTEFDSKYIKGDFGITTCDPHVVPLKSLKAFISTSIHQALAEERDRVRGEIVGKKNQLEPYYKTGLSGFKGKFEMIKNDKVIDEQKLAQLVSDGYNQALDDLKPIISNILK